MKNTILRTITNEALESFGKPLIGHPENEKAWFAHWFITADLIRERYLDLPETLAKHDSEVEFQRRLRG